MPSGTVIRAGQMGCINHAFAGSGPPLDAGGTPELLCPEEGKAQAFNHLDKADIFPVDQAIRDADPARYDGLVLPGGVAHPDQLRMVPAAVKFAQAMFASAKPAAVICHGSSRSASGRLDRGTAGRR